MRRLPNSGRSTSRTTSLQLPFDTARLTVREFTAADLDAIWLIVCDPRVTRYMFHSPRTHRDAEDYLARVLGYQEQRPREIWELGVAKQPDGGLIGACTLTIMSAREADLGYMLRRDAWQQGYATELAQSLVSAGFRDLRLERIISTVDVRNTASIKVLEKVGLRWEATYRRLKRVRGHWRDCHLYALARAAWEPATS